ncbi:hypothetical protein [Candidatus Enterococcus clewellii]|uniref:Uncharacterized protein n=1 Tax=Candidatus Enterococcus clewellii TaxID=1834193 RepID=A0A242KCE9_9ENTE|nr:hypothetical protein [Enterococcus sp. 9E7_DIV0242]OTP18841.1 hypothetical protein A5888_000655 [Enterococcus sp. 9E7_DIV0242]
MRQQEIDFISFCRGERKKQYALTRNYDQVEKIFQPVFEKKRSELKQQIHSISKENFHDQLIKIIRLDAELVQIMRMLVLFEDENLTETFMFKQLNDFAIHDYYQFLQTPHAVDQTSLLYPTIAWDR